MARPESAPTTEAERYLSLSLAHESPLESDLLAVESSLTGFLDQRRRSARSLSESYVRLWQSVADACSGGKRLRPRLLLTAFHGFGAPKARRSAATAASVAFELLHTALLVHDDVLDNEFARRGRPNISGTYYDEARAVGAVVHAERRAVSASVVAGDLLLHTATDQIARLDIPRALHHEILDVFDRALFVTAAGELADIAIATGTQPPSEAQILLMSEEKTAEYSVSAPLIAGALLAGAGPDDIAVLRRYGAHTGLAFQLGDDLLGIFGDEAITGKSTLSDIREGKETTLIAAARTTPHWSRLASDFGRTDLSASDGARFADTLEVCGARSHVESLLTNNVAAACRIVQQSELPPILVTELVDFAKSCIARVS